MTLKLLGQWINLCQKLGWVSVNLPVACKLILQWWLPELTWSSHHSTIILQPVACEWTNHWAGSQFPPTKKKTSPHGRITTTTDMNLDTSQPFLTVATNWKINVIIIFLKYSQNHKWCIRQIFILLFSITSVRLCSSETSKKWDSSPSVYYVGHTSCSQT